jgi:hypothetical protein
MSRPRSKPGRKTREQELEEARAWAEAHPEFGYDREETLLGKKPDPDMERDRHISYNFDSEDELDRKVYAPTERKRGFVGADFAADDPVEPGGRQVQSRSRDAEYNQQYQEREEAPEDGDFYHAWTYLDPKHKTVLEMVVVEGRTFTEVASELGIAESTVKVPRGRYPKALAAWRKVVAEHYFHGKPGECPDGPYGIRVVVPTVERPFNS